MRTPAIIATASLVACLSLFGCGGQQSTSSDTAKEEPAATQQTEVPTEYKNALEQAKQYLKTKPMSYKGLYDQLTSEYGSKFPAEAAQYAVDNVGADWNDEALQAAKLYQDQMHLSTQQIYDQLIAPSGEQFTEEQAQYAIDHLGS